MSLGLPILFGFLIDFIGRRTIICNIYIYRYINIFYSFDVKLGSDNFSIIFRIGSNYR